MSTFEIKMPKMGESVQEATITKWFIEQGQTIKEDDVLLEIATDKVDSEIPSPVDGKIIDVRFNVGDVVPVGEIILVVDLTGESEVIDKSAESHQEVAKKNEPTTKNSDSKATANHTDKSDRFYSPLVKNIAKKENISMNQLDAIEGTGRNGRVRKQDLLAFIEKNPTANFQPTDSQETSSMQKNDIISPPQSLSGQHEIIEMTRMRKIIAERMVASKHSAAQVTSMVEIDVENLVKWRNKNKDAFLKQEGVKLTFMPVFIDAVSKALKDFPLINVSVSETNIILKKEHNIGIAVALRGNNLIVPVLKNADRKSITGLAHELTELADKARNNKLSPDDIQGGTFSITNFGSFGNIMGTPIINQPESAILAVGTIEKKPAVLETEHGDLIVARHKMFLSLTYDHRVIDGALGGAFLRKVGNYLEQFDLNKTL